MKWARHVAHREDMRTVNKILVRKPTGKRPLRRPRHRWKDNIRMYVRKIGWKGVKWIHLAHYRDQRRLLCT